MGIEEKRKSIDEDLQLIPTTGILFLLLNRRIEFNSEVSPETLNINNTSNPFCIDPIEPWFKEDESNATDGVPKLERVDEILLPIIMSLFVLMMMVIPVMIVHPAAII